MAFRPFLFIYFSIKEKPQLNQGMENKNRFPPLLYFLSCSVYLAVFQFPAEGSEPLSTLETFRVGTMSPAWWLVGGHPGEADPRQPSPACWLVARVEHHWSGEGGGGPSVAPTNGCFPAGSLSPPTSQPVCAWFHCTGCLVPLHRVPASAGPTPPPSRTRTDSASGSLFSLSSASHPPALPDCSVGVRFQRQKQRQVL